MQKAIILALKELWQFFWETLGLIDSKVKNKTNLLLPSSTDKTPTLLPEGREDFDVIHNDLSSVQPGQFYLSKKSPLLRAPYLQFDGVLGLLGFGEAVTLKEYSGDYGSVLTSLGAGFVHKDALVSSRQLVWPQLKNDQIYEANSPETKSIRALSEDEFCVQDLFLPLLAPEYVTYRLKEAGVSIPWPPQHPERAAGGWRSILKGVAGVHIGLVPKTGIVMEWYSEDGEASLAYVDATLPDQSIIVSTVGLHELGQYSSLTITKNIWLEWQPVFIEVL